jgi:hypothetical protein
LVPVVSAVMPAAIWFKSLAMPGKIAVPKRSSKPLLPQRDRNCTTTVSRRCRKVAGARPAPGGYGSLRCPSEGSRERLFKNRSS